MADRQSSDERAAVAARMMSQPLSEDDLNRIIDQVEADAFKTARSRSTKRQLLRDALFNHARDVRSLAGSVVSQADGPEA